MWQYRQLESPMFDSETMSDCTSAQLVCLSCPQFVGCQAGNRLLEMIAEEQIAQQTTRHRDGSITIVQVRRRTLTLRGR